jgi:hypothetical protein
MRRSLKLFQYGTVAPCSNHTCSNWGNHYIGGDIYSLIGANCYCQSCIDNLVDQIFEEYETEEETSPIVTEITNEINLPTTTNDALKETKSKQMGRPKKEPLQTKKEGKK